MNTVKNNFFLALVFTTVLAGAAHAQAPTAAPVAKTQPLELQARTMTGEPFALDRLKGKVSIVFFWSTACAVCRDSLPELRANLAGWRDKPFALVTVNVDRNANDWMAYEKILSKTQLPPKNLFTLRLDDGKTVPTKLPLTLLVNAQGKIISRYEGRLAPEAWDGVADLLL